MFYLQLPLTRKNWLEKYYAVWIKNGINFYGWYASDEYYEKYGSLAKMNSRHNNASFNSISELREAMEIIDHRGDKFSYVLNASNVSSDVSWVLHHIDLINTEIKPKSVIVTDLAFIPKIDSEIDINISSFVWVNNSYAIQHLLSEFPNIKRIIYQRDVILPDTINIFDAIPDLEYEIFIKNMWCYHNGHCTSHHKKQSQYICLREKAVKNTKWLITKDKAQQLQGSKNDCKVCSIYKIKDRFLRSKKAHMYLKVPWREFEVDKVVKDAKFIDETIENCKSEENYKAFIAKNIHKHRKIYGWYCDYKKCEYYLEASKQ